MQYSQTSTEKNGILQACERFTRLGDAGITGTAATLAEFTNYVNLINRNTWVLIFRAYGGWQYDDGNQVDLPASTATLTSGQTSYALPTSALTVRGIEFKDQGGIWKQLRPITEEQIRDRNAMGEWNKTPGVPMYYQLVGQTVRIFPSANWTQADSFKVFYDRGSVSFLTTDTAETPGFASEFHDILPLGASCLWFEINTPDDLTYPVLKARYEQKKIDLVNFYQAKWSNMFPHRLGVRDSVREYT